MIPLTASRHGVRIAVRCTERKWLMLIQLRFIRILCLHSLGAEVHILQVTASCSPILCENVTDTAIYRLLLFINTVQFLLCAIQIVLRTDDLFIVFTVVTDLAAYSDHINPRVIGANVIYNISVGLCILVLPSIADLSFLVYHRINLIGLCDLRPRTQRCERDLIDLAPVCPVRQQLEGLHTCSESHFLSTSMRPLTRI